MVFSLIPASIFADQSEGEPTVIQKIDQNENKSAEEILEGSAEAEEPVNEENPAAEFEKTEEVAEDQPKEEAAAEQPDSPQSLNDGDVSVEGILPQGTKVNASAVEFPAPKRGAKGVSGAKGGSEANVGDIELNSKTSEDFAAVYDIKLRDAEGNAIQPSEAVTVSIDNVKLNGDKAIVYHILEDASAIERGINNGTVKTVTSGAIYSISNDAAKEAAVKATGAEDTVYVEIIEAAVENGTVTFQATSFSIYAIGEGDNEVPRTTFNFKNADDSTYTFENTAGQTVDNQILKTGDEIEDVGTPIVPDGTTFNGWYVYLDDQPAALVTFGKTVTVTFGDEKSVVANQDGTLIIVITRDDREFDVKPYFGEVYFLTFYDDVNGRVILNMLQVPKSEDPENPTQFNFGVVGTATVTDTTTAFVGWTTDPENHPEPEYDSGSIIEVTSDMVFYPVFKTGHWIYFVSAPEGSGATYIAPVFVPLDQPASSVRPTTNPTWKNHTFLYWVTHDDQGEELGEFDWSTVPETDITLYGKWRADDVKYIISIYKQNVTDDKNATDANKSYSFFRQYEFTATAGTLKVYTPEEYKTMTTTDSDNFTGFVYNNSKSDNEADLKSDGTTNIKLYYDRVTVTMNFIGYPGGTDTVYIYTALDQNDNTTRPQYGQVNGVYKQLTLGEPTIRYEYPAYNGTNYSGSTLYGTNDGGTTYFQLTVSSVSTTEHYLATRAWSFGGGYTYTEYTNRPVYLRSGSLGSYSYTATNTPVYNNSPYFTRSGNRWGYDQGDELYWQERTTTTYTFTNATTGEVYWTGVITSTNRPSLYTRTEVQIQNWLYDGEPYYGARYSRSSSSQTGLVYTGLYGQTLEQNNYSWPGTDGSGNPCYWQYDNDQGSLTGMSYLGEFVLPDGVADPNGQIINLHYNSIDDSSVIEFYLMDTDGDYSDTPNDSGIVTRGGTFTFSEKYDGFNVSQYRRYYMDGNTKVYVDSNGNRVTDPDAAWATATVNGTAELSEIVRTGNNNDKYWYFDSTNNAYPDKAYPGIRYTGQTGNNGTRIYTYAGNGIFNSTNSYLRNVTETTSNNTNPQQYGEVEFSGGTTAYVALSRGDGGLSKYCNLEIRYARKQWMLSFVDSLDGYSTLINNTDNTVIPSKTLYYNEELTEYEPAETVIPKSSSAGYVFKGWYKDQACTDPFDWSENMPNADLKVYAGWEEEWFYVKLIPDGGVLLTSQATYFWETYGEEVVEYGTITKNFIEDSNGPYVYYFGEFDTTFGGTGDRNAPQATYRYALYFTNDGTKVVVENPDGTKTESEYVTAYRNKYDDQGNPVYDDDHNIVQEPYQIPASTIYNYGVENGFINTSKHYRYEKDAYALVGWYDVTDGTRKVYNFDGGVNKDTILQAYWRKVGEYHIRYSNIGVDENGNALDPTVLATSVASDSNTYADNSDSAITGVAGAPEGYEFAGWYYDGHEGLLQKGDAFTLKAQYADEDKVIWMKPVFVKTENLPVNVTHILYDGNGGTTTMTSNEANHIVVNEDQTQIDYQALQINAAQTLLGADAFTRTGYTLKGWALTPNKTTPDFELGQENVAADNLDVTGNTLYAVWEIKTYTVTINKVVTPEGIVDSTSFAFSDPAFTPLISAYQGTFSLQNGGSKVYAEVPYGTTFKVTEDSYTRFETTLKYTVDSADDESKNVTDQAATNGQTFTVDGNVTVTVTNELQLTSLTIKKSGSSDSAQSFLFKVKGADSHNSGVQLTVAVQENGQVTISNLLVGNYTVEELTDWSWRYTFTSAQLGSDSAVTANNSSFYLAGDSNTLIVTNTRSNQYWLSGDSFQINNFDAVAINTGKAILPKPVRIKHEGEPVEA